MNILHKSQSSETVILLQLQVRSKGEKVGKAFSLLYKYNSIKKLVKLNQESAVKNLLANASRCNIVDADLKALEKCQEKLEKWQLRFNPIKCKVLQISSNDNAHNMYSLDGIELEYIESEKDLCLSLIISLIPGITLKSVF